MYYIYIYFIEYIRIIGWINLIENWKFNLIKRTILKGISLNH